MKSTLGFTSTQKVVKLVRAVLSQVRRSLSHDQASIFIKSLPSLFQLLFVANWKYEETDNAMKHLDELVENVYQEDQRSNHALFTSEIDTLNTVILVLHKLDKFFGIMGLNIWQYPLPQELKQAAMEDAV